MNTQVAPLPALPLKVEQLINQPWSKESSLSVDRWLDYVDREWRVKK